MFAVGPAVRTTLGRTVTVGKDSEGFRWGRGGEGRSSGFGDIVLFKRKGTFWFNGDFYIRGFCHLHISLLITVRTGPAAPSPSLVSYLNIYSICNCLTLHHLLHLTYLLHFLSLAPGYVSRCVSS